MPRNGKYVSIKGPLDFFTPEELTKFRGLGSLFFLDFVDRVLPYRDAGVRVRAILNWQPSMRQSGGGGKMVDVAFPPAPFEISDAIIRVIGPLWGKAMDLEPFFTVTLTEEICDPVDPEILLTEREKDVVKFERAVLVSSLSVFFALHLGWNDLAFLNGLRARVIQGLSDDQPEVRNLVQLAEAAIDEIVVSKRLKPSWLAIRPEPVAWKIAARLERVATQFSAKTPGPSPTIYGQGGLVSA
jgi:hypothetical protein